MPANWTERWVRVAEEIASWSKDPERKVGCVIFDQDMNQVSGGFNGFPKGFKDLTDRYEDKEYKLQVIVHSEANAIARAAKRGISVNNCVMICTSHPCSTCAGLIIQAGIKQVIAIKRNYSERWQKNHAIAAKMFEECGVEFSEFEKLI